MRKLILLIAVLPLAARAQKPEPVLGNARENRSLESNREQRQAWRKVIDAEPKNAQAWYYYFKAQKNLIYNDTTDNRPPRERHKDLEKVVDEMGKAIPESYEYNLCRWSISAGDRGQLKYLMKAAELGEGRSEHLDYMINEGELTRDLKMRDLYSEKKFRAGTFSSGLIYYNYNVLSGLEPNAILVTTGDNDTYPAWLLQSRGIRRDVTVVNDNLMQIEWYREKVFAELGVGGKALQAQIDSLNPDNGNFSRDLVALLLKNTRKLPLNIALTAAYESCIGGLEGKLFLTGLAYRYSEQPMDNLALLKKNFEHAYALDYLDKSFFNDISPEKVGYVNSNYIVPMLKLYAHYKTAGDSQKQAWMREKLLMLSKGMEQEAEVKKQLEL